MKTIAKLFCVVAVASLTINGASAATTPHQSKTYTAGPVADVVQLCAEDNRTGENLAAACFSAAPGSKIKIRVKDDISTATQFYWELEDAEGDCHEAPDPETMIPLCPHAGIAWDQAIVTVPSGFPRLYVGVYGPVLSNVSGAVDGREDVATPTTGTITIDPVI